MAHSEKYMYVSVHLSYLMDSNEGWVQFRLITYICIAYRSTHFIIAFI